MLKTILVPLDGSSFGEHALPLAVSLARRAGAELQLLRVQPPLATLYGDIAPLSGEEPLENRMRKRLWAADHAYLESLIQRIGEPSVRVLPIAVEGEVAKSIRSTAEKAEADLVVMTTHGRGPLGRLWLGSVTDELVRSLQMPILLVPPTDAIANLSQEAHVNHIVLPLDGTELAEQILPAATELGRLMKARFTLVRVVKPAYDGGYTVYGGARAEATEGLAEEIGAVEHRQRAEAQRYLEEVAGGLRSVVAPVFTRVLTEPQPGPAVLDLAVELGADLVALETHGRRGLGRLLLGSVADKVLRAGLLPVLLHSPKT